MDVLVLIDKLDDLDSGPRRFVDDEGDLQVPTGQEGGAFEGSGRVVAHDHEAPVRPDDLDEAVHDLDEQRLGLEHGGRRASCRRSP